MSDNQRALYEATKRAVKLVTTISAMTNNTFLEQGRNIKAQATSIHDEFTTAATKLRIEEAQKGNP